MIPGGFNTISEIVARRATLDGLLQAMTADLPPNPNVSTEDRTIPGPDGDLLVRIYQPVNASGIKPGLLFIHGGGMVLGNLETDHPMAVILCENLDAVVVSVDYRLAPEHPAPAAISDCFAGLIWMAANASDLGFDPARLGIFGGSAGGGLAIATALMSRDNGGPDLAFLMPVYPMIDDRNETASSRDIVDIGIWDRAGNIEAWGWYLGGRPANQYSAPARATDLTGLPPSFIDVGDRDLFHDEDVEFADRLRAAGVPVELHINPGAYHASEVIAPTAALSQQIWERRLAALQRALGKPVLGEASARQPGCMSLTASRQVLGICSLWRRQGCVARATFVPKRPTMTMET
ncbi:MAG: alpha/beta hydrolase [Actinobacteria bacterium]|nr:alpha/beta hydrolase [Actinomycetota bacterium]